MVNFTIYKLKYCLFVEDDNIIGSCLTVLLFNYYFANFLQKFYYFLEYFIMFIFIHYFLFFKLLFFIN